MRVGSERLIIMRCRSETPRGSETASPDRQTRAGNQSVSQSVFEGEIAGVQRPDMVESGRRPHGGECNSDSVWQS